MTPQEEPLFYYALYSQLAHWGSLMLTIGALATVGLNLSTSSTPAGHRRWICSAIVAALASGSVFFIWRIYFYSEMARRYLPDHFVRELNNQMATPKVLWLAAVAVGMFVTVSLALLHYQRTRNLPKRVEQPSS